MTKLIKNSMRFAAAVIVGGASSALTSCANLERDVPPLTALSSAGASAQCARGRDIYLNNCTECHSPEPIRKNTQEDWETDILPTMARKAKLSTDETEAVHAYVLAVLRTPEVH